MERSDASPRGRRTRVSGVRLIVLMCAAEGLAVLGFSTFPALQPALLAEWSLSNTEAGWINGIYFAAYIAAVPVLVSLTDRVDPRRVYALGAVVSMLSALGFALLAEGFWSRLVLQKMIAAVGFSTSRMRTRQRSLVTPVIT